MSVCYMGAFDPTYPRNLILRRGLELQGVEVIACNAPRRLGTWGRTQALMRQFPTMADQCAAIVLAEFGQALAPAAWWLARRYRKPLIVDAFTSVYDSAVHDRAVAGPRSPGAARYWLIDWLALRLADRLITDTAQHATYFAQTFRMPRERIHVVPVGAAREWFETPAAEHGGAGVLITFFGTYIPLHGIETILQAAHHLKGRTDMRFELIGRGQTYGAMRALAERLALTNVTFCEPVPPDDLPGLAARADICLGIFGVTDKAGRVIPNKVYQTLALGKAVITADTPPIRNAFTPGEHLLTVSAGDAAALAERIAALADSPEQRAALGRAGRARMAAMFDEAALGRRLLDVMT